MVRGRFAGRVRKAEVMKIILYVHGMGGSPSEAERYKKICPCFDVIGAEYDGSFPAKARDDIRRIYDGLRGNVYVLANSIGAYFAMLALQGCDVEKAMFISPILNMERVILDMMNRSGVSEDDLRLKGEIVTASGDLLSWEYLRFVRENPLTWNAPTEILYAGNDTITSRETVNEFLSGHDVKLTVMDNGEHWFHTEEQIAFLDEWLRRVLV